MRLQEILHLSFLPFPWVHSLPAVVIYKHQLGDRLSQFQIYSHISEAISHLQYLGIAQGGTQDIIYWDLSHRIWGWDPHETTILTAEGDREEGLADKWIKTYLYLQLQKQGELEKQETKTDELMKTGLTTMLSRNSAMEQSPF